MIYLYGLAEAEPAILARALDGFQGLEAPVDVASAGPWALVHSVQSPGEILPKRRLMLAHTRIVEQMLTIGAVLPARFGLVADSLPQTQELIRQRAPDVAAAFAKVRDCVELGVRIQFDRDHVLAATLAANPALRAARDKLINAGPEAHFAMAEFGGKLADQVDRRRGEAQKAVLAQLRPLAVDHLLRAPEHDTEVLRAEFLVEQSEINRFERAVAAATQDLTFASAAEPDIRIIGPAPAYHFVQLNLSPDTEAAA